MLPVILGVLALGTAGYGVKKCLTDEEFVDNAKDKIQDLLISGYEGIETLEEKMGLYDEAVPLKGDAMDKILFEAIAAAQTANLGVNGLAQHIKVAPTSKKKETPSENKEFAKLYKLKKSIRQKLSDEYGIAIFASEEKIKKDKTKGVAITEAMRTNLSSYEYLLKTAYAKIKYALENKTDEDIEPYVTLLKDLFSTRIVQKGRLNEQSSQLIIDGMHIVLGQKPPIRVDLA